MFGILIFVLCTAGIVYLVVRGRRRFHHYGPFAAAWAHAGHPVWPVEHPGRMWLHRTLAELDATPAQERAIVDAVHSAIDELHSLAAPVKDARRKVAQAFRGDALSEQDVAAAFAEPEQSLTQARGIVARALTSIHSVLDERQRRVLARRLERHHHC